MLVLCEEEHFSANIKEWKVVVVDGDAVKADTWYKLEDGEVKEVRDE